MWRFLETLSRRKMIFLLPVIIVPLIAVAGAVGSNDRQVTAVAWVEASSAQNSLSGGANDAEAQRMNESLSTDSFRRALLDEAGLTERARTGTWPQPTEGQSLVKNVGLASIPPLRSFLGALGVMPSKNEAEALSVAVNTAGRAVHVSAEGNNLLNVSYSGPDPEVGAQLVAATISLYLRQAVEQRVDVVRQRVDLYTNELDGQRERVNAASIDLQTYLATLVRPVSAATTSIIEAAELDRLQRNFDLQQTIYEDLARKVDVARVDLAATSNQRTGLRVIDPPDASSASGAGLRGVVFSLFGGVLLGVTIGVLGILTAVWLDSRVRTRGDVVSLVRAPMHFQVPKASSSTVRPRDIGRLLVRDL